MANNFEINLDPDAWSPIAGSDHPDRAVHLGQPCWVFPGDNPTQLRSKLIQMPAAFAGGTLKLDILFDFTVLNSGDFVLGINAESLASGDSFSSESLDSTVASTIAVPSTLGDVAIETIEITSDDGAVAGEWFRLKFNRATAHANDDAETGSLRLLGATLREES